MTLGVAEGVEIVSLAVKGIEAIISLAEKLGKRDAVLAALDATLAAARARTDDDLARKHRGDEPTGKTTVPGDSVEEIAERIRARARLGNGG